MDLLTAVQQNTASWTEKPFSPLDAIVLAQLAYYQLPQPTGTLANLAQFHPLTDYTTGTMDAQRGAQLLAILSTNPRYQQLKWLDQYSEVDPTKEVQFVSLMVQLPTNEYVLSFRGTPATTVGWKEDLNMTYEHVVPAQQLALTTFNQLRQAYGGQWYLTGHSKGGNLATYVGLAAPRFQRAAIHGIYNFDGPGFLNQTARFEAAFAQLGARYHKYVPSQSLIGLLLEDRTDYQVVLSHGLGIAQHNVFNWEFTGTDLVTVPQLAPLATTTKDKIDQWLIDLPPQDRQAFLDTAYAVTRQARLNHLKELQNPTMVKTLYQVSRHDPELKQLTEKVLRTFLQTWLPK